MAVSALAPLVAHAEPLESQFDAVLGTMQRTPRAAAPVAPRADALEYQLAALAEASRGRIGVAALDLDSGRTVAVLGDQPFPMASTSKIAIVATFLAGVDQGRYRLTDQYPLLLPLPSKKFDGAVAPVRAGTMLSAEQLIELAITRSDNHATDALLAAVGGPIAVTRWVRITTGISEFRLDRDIATLVRDDGAVNPALVVDRRDSITPAAMVRMLSGLHRGQWLSGASRNVLLGAMSRCQTGRNRIRALLPEGTAIAHKTGTLSNTASDVGFIVTPDGRNLAVAIYVTGQGGKQDRDSRIALLARAIYDGYTAQAPRRAALR
jgi:beta-lactamase class A